MLFYRKKFPWNINGDGIMDKLNYELIYKVRKNNFRTDSKSNLRIQFENKAREEADKLHQAYFDFLKKELKTDQLEVTNIMCLADGIIGHVYKGDLTHKGFGKRKCIFCGCDDFDD